VVFCSAAFGAGVNAPYCLLPAQTVIYLGTLNKIHVLRFKAFVNALLAQNDFY
jgi:hypothetical protein